MAKEPKPIPNPIAKQREALVAMRQMAKNMTKAMADLQGIQGRALGMVPAMQVHDLILTLRVAYDIPELESYQRGYNAGLEEAAKIIKGWWAREEAIKNNKG